MTMNARRWIVSMSLGLAGVAACAAAGLRLEPVVVNGGGGVQSAGTVVLESEVGGFVGLSTQGVCTMRAGFAGQLNELTAFTTTAASVTVPEASTVRIHAGGSFTDGTSGDLPDPPDWTTTGPIDSVDGNGVALAGLVFQNSPAAIQAVYGGYTSSVGVVVVNVGNDDYGAYAHDGVEDAWQVSYFGTADPEGRGDRDWDHDGSINSAEFGATTDPTNSLSVLAIVDVRSATGTESVRWIGGTAATQYLESASSLATGTWMVSQTNLPPTSVTNDYQVSSPPGAVRFYRVRARR